MKSEDTAHQLLPWFLTGRLDPALAQEFREHLASCADCRDEVALVRELQGELDLHGAAYLEDHPPAERIVALEQGRLRDAEATRLRKHLALCESCAEEAGWVAGRSAYTGEPSPASRNATRRAPAWAWAAAAAAVLLVALVPLLRGTGPVRAPTGLVRVFHVEATDLSATEQNVFTLDPGLPGFALMFRVDVPQSDFPVRVVLRDEAGAVVHEEASLRSDALIDGYANLACARRDCPPGRYALEVYASGAGHPAQSFSFRLAAR